MDSGEQFGFPLGEQSKNIVWNTVDFGTFSRQHRSTDPPGGPRNTPFVAA